MNTDKLVERALASITAGSIGLLVVATAPVYGDYTRVWWLVPMLIINTVFIVNAAKQIRD